MGHSGSGKSTITKMLLKYYEPESGEIRVNGVNLNEYTNRFGAPAPFLTYRRTLSFSARPSWTTSASRALTRRWKKSRRQPARRDAHEFYPQAAAAIPHLPGREAGNGLSGGEKQRIALARAFLKDSNLYILDESTSNLDFATENAIFDMIYHQLADRSMLIVAHRLSTVRGCDQIIVMDEGRIVEQGTHDELMAKEGKYYALWNLQAGHLPQTGGAQARCRDRPRPG